jgi:hypothetical protein
MDLPDTGEDKWFLDWVVASPKHSGRHLACSYLTFESILDVYPAGTIDSVLEPFAGMGAHALMLEDLFRPGIHVVRDYAPEAVEHMKRVLPPNVTVVQADAYDPKNTDSAGLVAMDFGDLTVVRSQPGRKWGDLLDRTFALEPMAVTITDISAPRLHLNRKHYERELGVGTCDTYLDYLNAFTQHLADRYGYVLHQANYTRWSCVMAFVPEFLAVPESGGIYELPEDVIGLVISE